MPGPGREKAVGGVGNRYYPFGTVDRLGKLPSHCVICVSLSYIISWQYTKFSVISCRIGELLTTPEHLGLTAEILGRARMCNVCTTAFEENIVGTNILQSGRSRTTT
jgi:hypothetical protein